MDQAQDKLGHHHHLWDILSMARWPTNQVQGWSSQVHHQGWSSAGQDYYD
jgi:hypothetical protein